MQRVKAVVDRISTRLVGLLLLPVLAATLFASTFAYERHSEAESLNRVRADSEVVASLSQLRAQLALERTLVSGFSAIAELGITDPNIGNGVVTPENVETDGINMLASLDQNRSKVDEWITKRPACTPGQECAVAVTYLENLSQVRLHASNNQYELAIAGYDATIGHLDDWIDGVTTGLEQTTVDRAETRALLDVLTELQVLAAAADSDLELFVPLLANFGVNPDPILDSLIGNAAVAEQSSRTISSELPAQLTDAWATYERGAAPGTAVTMAIIEDVRALNGNPLGFDALLEAGRDVDRVSQRLNAVSIFQAEVGQALVAQAAIEEAEARRTLRDGVILSFVALLTTFVGAFIIARHFARSMRQLGQAAESLQTGDFNAEELPTRGPREIVDAARAFSTLTDTLRAVDAHATAIATGESVSADLLLPVPGHIGESLRNSLQRVESMTERLRHEANHDELTGLFNRSGVWDELDELLAEPDTLITIMFIDLDRFKRVNDTHGHQVGDALLNAAGFRLENTAGPARTVARLGGDEFLVVASDLTDEAAAVSLAEDIAAELDKPFTIDGRVLRISASVGIAQEFANGQTVANILQLADLAAYEAKRHRKKSVVFSDDVLLAQAVEMLHLEEALRGSWSRGEIKLFLQPLVQPLSGQAASAEALMRWTRSDGTSVSPGQFIPIAEESGMIVTIDEWMINETCRQLAEWKLLGQVAGDIRVAVNISGQHFTDGDLVATILHACKIHDTDPKQLVIEVTESCAVEDIAHTVAVLEELHDMGITISLDDFGTGYSSLSYLQQLPIDTVKIDKSFIDDLATDGANAKIVELVATLSTVLELAVVAEGVETPEQAKRLTELGIDYLQGYYFARPMPAGAFNAWMETSATPLPAAATKN